MEYNLEKKSLQTADILLDTVSEQVVDLDLVLPDYCPDIERILKCTLTPQIYNRNLSGGQLQIEGGAKVCILYCDSIKKNVRSCEQTVPFSAEFSVKSSQEQQIILNDIKTEYVNCRALSPRKLVIHGAFSLYTKVLTKGVCELFNYESDNELQVKTQKVNAARVTGFCQEMFSVTEDIQIVNKPPVDAVLCSTLNAALTQIKTVQNKLMIKGELNLKMLYLSDVDEGNIEQITYLIPFNQIIDCEGINEDTINNATVNVLSYEIRVKSEALSENPVVSLDSRLCFSEIGYECGEETVITDAYSVSCGTDIDLASVSVIKNVSVMSESFMNKAALSLEDMNISKLVDIYSEYCTVTPTLSESMLRINGKMNLCVVALDGDNMPIYFERSTEFEQSFALSSEFNAIEQVKVQSVSISYRLSQENSIEVRCEMKAEGVLQNRESRKIVCGISTDENRPVERDDCALTLYYAQPGENLWEIAKKYSTYYNMLTRENELEDENLAESRMLLISTP